MNIRNIDTHSERKMRHTKLYVGYSLNSLEAVIWERIQGTTIEAIQGNTERLEDGKYDIGHNTCVHRILCNGGTFVLSFENRHHSKPKTLNIYGKEVVDDWLGRKTEATLS